MLVRASAIYVYVEYVISYVKTSPLYVVRSYI